MIALPDPAVSSVIPAMLLKLNPPALLEKLSVVEPPVSVVQDPPV